MRSRLFAMALAGIFMFAGAGSVMFSDNSEAHGLLFRKKKKRNRGSRRRRLNIFQKIGAGFKKAGETIKSGFQKAGQAIKTGAQKVAAGAKKVGAAIVKGAKKVGSAIKKGLQKAFDFVKRIKDKVVAKMKAFLPKALEGVKKLGATILRTVIEKVIGKVGLTLTDFFKIVDPNTGKVNTEALSWFVVQRIGDFVKPIMQDKLQILVSKGLRLIQKPLDIAVSAILGGVGAIPFAGGLLVTGIHAAYTFAMDWLRDALAAKVTELVYDRMVAPLFRKGLQHLLGLSPKIKAAVEKLLAKATRFFQFIKPPTKAFYFSAGTGGLGAQGARLNARMQGKKALKAHDAKLKAAEDAARASKDAAHRRRGLLVERNVHGNTTSKRIYDAQKRAAAKRAAREAALKPGK